jgi:8-oxo-dGTP diphosphatase
MVDLYLAAAVVIHHDRVLIVRRSKHERFLPLIWGVPCGKIDGNEDPRRAVLRELKEETGLEGEVITEIGRSEFLSQWRGRETKNFQTNYLVYVKGQPTDTDVNNMPLITLPKRDQLSQWVRLTEVFDFDGVDEYNREIIRQGVYTIASRLEGTGAGR